jgi:hypothetical protein
MFGISGHRLVSSLLFVLLVQSGFATKACAQNTKKDDRDPPAKTDKTDDKDPKKSPKLVPAGTLVGKLIKLEEDGIKLEVSGKVFYKSGKQTREQTLKETYEIQVHDDVKVRLPVDIEFDDKGRPKKMKKDPNDKDAKLGGVKGAREDLANNQELEVSVSRLPNRKLVATTIKVLKKADK